ncbi:hypothetical protein BJ875DRAFT_441691 [Amylocarpus encephaloides]|uniref:Heterokaryon incompatibility domain-containing protein n=1 Tax=Amylocarpus encephaloides TaxID=45428 RepID=A0A9P7YID5_9HELO|nr:hypothetical protein BJ875DRAFT_441691 [Amylocarpus encephaloides]
MRRSYTLAEWMESIAPPKYSSFGWLGESRDGSDIASEHIESINEKLKPILQIDTPERAIFLKGQLRGKELSSSGLPVDDDLVWSALRDFYSRSWFNPLWVLQEVALYKQLVVALGNRRVAWDLLVTFGFLLPVDKIYGLLGLIDPDFASQIVVGYSWEAQKN